MVNSNGIGQELREIQLRESIEVALTELRHVTDKHDQVNHHHNFLVVLYRMGIIFFIAGDDSSLCQNDAKRLLNELEMQVQKLMQTWQPSYAHSLATTFKEVFLETLLEDKDLTKQNDLIGNQQQEALQSVAALYQRFSATLVTRAQWKLSEIQSLLEHHIPTRSSTHVVSTQEQPPLLQIIAALTFETNLSFAEFMDLHTQLTDMGVWYAIRNVYYNQKSNTLSWKSKFLNHFANETEREYIDSVLEQTMDDDVTASSQLNRLPPTEQSNSQKQAATLFVSPSEAMTQRIEQIHQVFPHLGQGFIEAVVSHFKGDVERSLSALVDENEQLPSHLKMMDRNLPRRHRVDDTKRQEEEERLAKEVTKQAIRDSIRQEEEKAQALDRFLVADEYDDDYDDQYDEIDGRVADVGLYDNYEDVKIYNQTVRDMEKEQSFWEENRNTNRTEKGSQEKIFGPDKIKGGRIPKPKPPDTEQPTKNSKQKQNKIANRRAKQKDANIRRSGFK